jgi:hypothetical protein
VAPERPTPEQWQRLEELAELRGCTNQLFWWRSWWESPFVSYDDVQQAIETHQRRLRSDQRAFRKFEANRRRNF